MDSHWTKTVTTMIAERRRQESSPTDPIVWLTAALVALTALAGFAALLQWRTLEKTDDTTWATNRPWLRVTPELKGPVQLEAWMSHSRKITMPLNFKLENVGNIPATDVLILANLAVAQTKKGDMFGGIGGVIPRKQPLKLEGDAENCLNEGEIFAKKEVTGPPVFPKQIVSRELQPDAQFGSDDRTYFELTGCVLYRTGKTPGRTMFRLSIGTTSGGFKFDTPILKDKDTKIGSVPIDQIKIETEYEGNTAE